MAVRSGVSQEFVVAFAAIVSLAGVAAQPLSANAQVGHSRQTVTGMRPAPGAVAPPNAPTSSAAATNRPGNAEQAPGSGSKSARDRMADSQYAKLPELPAPAHLDYTNDLQTCSIHGGLAGGLVCKALLPKGELALIWDYPSRAAITGFRVYSLGLSGSSLIYTQANGPGATMYVVDPPPSGGYGGACYAVTAFVGGRESAMSNPFCGNQARPVMLLNLTPTLRSSGRTNITKEAPRAFNASVPMVGFNYATWKPTLAQDDSYTNTLLRLGLLFDVSALKSRTIISARLRMEVKRTWTAGFDYQDLGLPGAPLPTSHSTSCTAKVFLAGDRWPENDDWIEEGPPVALDGAMEGPDIMIDVTRAARTWATGIRNDGIVLEGAEENATAFTEKGCVTEYFPESISLEVLYD